MFCMGSGSRAAIQPVLEDLQQIFRDRLDAVVAYGRSHHGPVPSLVLVRSLTIEDLSACAGRVPVWHRSGAATPLLLTPGDFARSLDAFPIEYGEIIATQYVVFGQDPFSGLSIRDDDLRRACEVQVKSHLLHLREEFLESGGRPTAVDEIVRESAPAFAALLRNLARLDRAPAATSPELVDYATRRARLDERVVSDLLSLADSSEVSAVDPPKLFPAYVATLERLAAFVDQWRHS
jgi:hypothetical protein